MVRNNIISTSAPDRSLAATALRLRWELLQLEPWGEESECQVCKPWFSFVVRTKTLDIEAWAGSMSYATYKYCKEVESWFDTLLHIGEELGLVRGWISQECNTGAWWRKKGMYRWRSIWSMDHYSDIHFNVLLSSTLYDTFFWMFSAGIG